MAVESRGAVDALTTRQPVRRDAGATASGVRISGAVTTQEGAFGGDYIDRSVTLVAETPVPVASSNADRRWLFVKVPSDASDPVRIAFDEEASASSPFLLAPGAFFEPRVPPRGSVSAYSAGAVTLICFEVTA